MNIEKEITDATRIIRRIRRMVFISEVLAVLALVGLVILAFSPCRVFGGEIGPLPEVSDALTVLPDGGHAVTITRPDGWVTIDPQGRLWETREFGSGYITLTPDGGHIITIKE